MALALIGALALAGCGKTAEGTATTPAPTAPTAAQSSQPDPVSSIESMLDQAERDADSATN